MKTIFAWILLLFTLSLPYAQGNEQKGAVDIYMDFGRFKYDAQKTYLEIYYSVYVMGADSFENLPPAYLKLQLADATKGAVLAARNLEVQLNNPGMQGSNQGVLKLGLVKTVLPQGKYNLTMYRTDSTYTQKMDSITYQFSTAPFVRDKITLSDLELCNNIIPRSRRKNATFYKNTMEVIPNPSRVYGEGNPRVYYYIEVYNTQSKDPGESCQIQVVIADKDGNIRARKSYRRYMKYPSLVERGAFNVSRFESGLYTLIFAVTDSMKNYSIYRRANFIVNNPNVVVAKEEDEELAFLQSEFYNMPEDVVERMFDEARYIATPEEVKIFKSLESPESKRKFLFNFWKRRSKEKPDFKTEYYQRVEYANEHFKISGKPGWATDRGRVYILYGPPSNIERYHSEADVNPYEIWFYEELEGGVEFDFVDIGGHGDFELVNSTKFGEIEDPNWREYLYK